MNISTTPKNIWPCAWSGTEDNALVNFASAAAKAAVGSVTKEFAASNASTRRRTNQARRYCGVGGKRTIEKAARLRNIVRGQTLVEPSHTLKIKVRRVGGRRLLSATRLGGDKLSVQRIQPAARRFRPACRRDRPSGLSNRYASRDSACFQSFCPPALAGCQAGLWTGRL